MSRTLQSARKALNANATTIVNLDVSVQIHPTDPSRTANYTEDVAMDWVGNNTFFTVNDISYSQGFSRVQKLIRRGDILNYGGGHISMVYSWRPTCTKNKKNRTTCTYEIIHASGVDYFDFNGNKIADLEEFSRKVRINENKWMPNPSAFGRIKLWD